MNISLRSIVSTGMLVVLSACASSGSSVIRRAPDQAAPIAGGQTDASYDWHELIVVPFGTLLKDSPLPLHEVLLFHDETTRPETENKDCYSIETVPPRFLGQRPDPYLLCFDHDHLIRIEAAVQLAADDSPQVFARACALWSKNTVPPSASGTACEGRDGPVAFSARLARVTGNAMAVVSVTLLNPPRDP